MIQRRRLLKRSGTSLVEMVVFIGLTSMTLTLMSMLTHSILSLSRQTVTRSEVRQLHGRLLERLHRDAMNGTFSAAPTAEHLIAWQFADTRGKVVRYQVNAQTIDRTEVSLPAAEHREQFRLPAKYRFVRDPQRDNDAHLEIQIHEMGAASADGQAPSIFTGLRLRIMTNRQPRERTEAAP
jgi:hypothetical protein